METNFKELYSFDKRKNETDRIRKKFPDKVPIVLEKGGKDIDAIDKKKFLASQDLTIKQFMIFIRKKIKLKPEQAIFLFIGNAIPNGNMLLSQAYQENKDEDGFLYIKYTGESTYGCVSFYLKI